MRAADIVTIFRTILIAIVVYLILIKFNPFATIALFILALALDGIDGYLAVWQFSKGKVTFSEYLSAMLLKDKKAASKIHSYKSKLSERYTLGPRLDIAGDRFAEYSLWIVFTFLGIIPLVLLLAVVLRHSFADAIMGAKGTSSKMKSRFARIIYSSNVSRATSIILKVFAFSYLILVYVSNFPIFIGYILVGILFTFVMLRGAAEIYDGLNSEQQKSTKK